MEHNINGYPKYHVTESGDVLSLWFNKCKSLKQNKSHCGYLLVCLNANKRQTLSVHRLVAKAYIPNPDNKPEVNHIDGNKLNNHYTNLEWCTRKENVIHSFTNGLNSGKKGTDNPRNKLSINDIIKIKSLLGTIKQTDIANLFGVHQTLISAINTGKLWGE